MSNLSEEQVREARLAEYKEVAQNFRTLTEIRFKLLGFLPIGTALIALSTASSKSEITVPLSLFGLAVTLALIVYNERNDQLYDELVARGAQLERLLGLPDGNFSHRPGTWLKVRPIPETPNTNFGVTIEHRWPIETIYRASTIAWLFMLFSPIFAWLAKIVSAPPDFAGPLSTVFAVITAFSFGQLFLDWFKAQRSDRRKRMRKLAVEAVDRLAALKFSPPEEDDLAAWDTIFSHAAELRGGETKKESNQEFNPEFATILYHASFYLSHDLMQSIGNMYYPLPPLKSPFVFGVTTAAHVIGLLTDLPARWLIDVHSGRRGPKEESEEERKKSNRTKLIEWLGAIKR